MRIQPQEIEVWYLIPTIRSNMAQCLVRKGLSQKQVANALGITEAAVSQYISNKRAAKIPLSDNSLKKIDEISEEIIGGRLDGFSGIQKICMDLRETKEICKVHAMLEGVPKGCNACFEK